MAQRQSFIDALHLRWKAPRIPHFVNTHFASLVHRRSGVYLGCVFLAYNIKNIDFYNDKTFILPYSVCKLSFVLYVHIIVS